MRIPPPGPLASRLPSGVRDLARKAMRLVRVLLGKDLWPRLDHRCRSIRLGSDYGGWQIATESFDKSPLVYSFGVGEDLSFDVAVVEQFGAALHAFDPTPKSMAWVQRQSLPPSLTFHDYGIASFDGEAWFYPPENPAHVSHTMKAAAPAAGQAFRRPVHRLSTIMSQLGHQHLDILKMDIEGAEYRVIEDILESGIYPRQLLVEIHHRFPDVGVAPTRKAIQRLRRHGFRLFHVSPAGEEYGFLLPQPRGHERVIPS